MCPSDQTRNFVWEHATDRCCVWKALIGHGGDLGIAFRGQIWAAQTTWALISYEINAYLLNPEHNFCIILSDTPMKLIDRINIVNYAFLEL